MLKTDEQRKVVVTGMSKYLNCKVVRGNTTAPMPEFPYVLYNIITLANQNKGTYGEYEDGKSRKAIIQTWSITVHSKNYSEAIALANKAREWLDYVGTVYLNDNDVIVQSVGNVTDRSNLLTSEYVYSYGFDCYFWMYDTVDNPIVSSNEYIEEADINYDGN